MPDLIHARHLTRRFPNGVLALDNINLAVQQGEWLAVMGPSGSGKSTLLNLLGGLDRPDQGEIIFDGRDLTLLGSQEWPRFRRENIGFVFQQFHLIEYLTALENVMLAQYYHSMVDAKEAVQALENVGLQDRLDHYPSQLSGGEEQRVCVARALINQPKLILADEPTGNLDEKSEEWVLDLFRDLHSKGHTILMVTHDISVGRLANRQIQLEHGHIVGNYLSSLQAEEDVENFLKVFWELKEDHQLTRKFLEEKNFLDHALTVEYLQSKGDLKFTGQEVEFSPELEKRTKDIVRRYRLGEVLFSKTLHLDQEKSDKEACEFEHMLNPEMTEKICAFLEHPKICPHGRGIPPGVCCTDHR